MAARFSAVPEVPEGTVEYLAPCSTCGCLQWREYLKTAPGNAYYWRSHLHITEKDCIKHLVGRIATLEARLDGEIHR